MSLSDYQPHLDWIAGQHAAMLEMTLAWSRINSGSYHLDGLAKMADVLQKAFAPLEGELEHIQLSPMPSVNAKGDAITTPLGDALRIRKHPDAPLKVLLTGHMDTVFAKEHPFQTPITVDDNTVNGPGVADMKGGIVVFLHALKALERSPWAGEIGWEVLLNSDEEIGSIGSAPLLAESAKRNHIGLTYEPCLPDGTLAGARKGSGNFTAVMRGRAAHAGRNPEQGRNAIVALSEYILAINALGGQRYGLTVNPGQIEGGGATNVVPNLAICRFNVRLKEPEDMDWMQAQLDALTQEYNEREGFALELHGGFTRPPKPMTEKIEHLFGLLKVCGKDLGISIAHQDTGGCCDGNNLAAHGLPNVDTLGVCGGAIHSADEFLKVDSLTERAQLSALLLLRLAAKEVAWNP